MDEIVTPLPRPETTPPVTTMYFIFLVVVGDGGMLYQYIYISLLVDVWLIEMWSSNCMYSSALVDVDV